MLLTVESRAEWVETGESPVQGSQLPETEKNAGNSHQIASTGISGDDGGYIRRDRCECCEFICPAWFVKDGLCDNCANGIHLSPDWERCLNKPDIPEHLKRAQPRYPVRSEPAEALAKGRGRRQQQETTETNH